MVSSTKDAAQDASLRELMDANQDVIVDCKLLDTEEKREKVVKALESIREEVHKATGAMSSVPKPLKFMRERFDELAEAYTSTKDTTDVEVMDVRKLLADLLSVLSYTLPCVPVQLSDFNVIPEMLQKMEDKNVEDKKATDGTLEKEDKKRDLEKKEQEVHKDEEEIESFLQTFEKDVNQRSKDLFQKGYQAIRQGVLYRLEGSKDKDLFKFGREYIRSLTVDVIGEYDARYALQYMDVAVPGYADMKTNEEVMECLKAMARLIVRDDLNTNMHIDAVDLASEMREVNILADLVAECIVDESVKLRIAEYMIALAKYDNDMTDVLLEGALKIVLDMERPAEGLRYAATAYSRWALKREQLQTYVLNLFQTTYGYEDKQKARSQRLQMLFMLGDCDIISLFELEKSFINNIPETSNIPPEEIELWGKVFNREMMKDYFKHLREELDLEEPKHPDDVYKTYLTNTSTAGGMDSAGKNKASTYVSAFVNAGFGKGCQLTADGNDTTWIFKNHMSSISAAAASAGALHMWNVEDGYQAMDAYQWSEDGYVKAGSNIGFGLVSAGTSGEFNVALELIADSLTKVDKPLEVKCALIGLSLAYNNRNEPSLYSKVAPLAFEGGAPDNETASLAALTLAMNGLGTKDVDIAESLLQLMMTLNMTEGDALDIHFHYKFLMLSLGFLYMGAGEEEAEGSIEVISNMGNTPYRRACQILLEGLSSVGSGNLDLQARMYRIITDGADVDRDVDAESSSPDVPESDQKDAKEKYTTDLDRKMAVLGCALIGMGDEIATSMILKAAESWIHFGDLIVVRTVPLALAILFASNPQTTVVDLLSKLSHDSDAETALTAIISLAIVAAGTNNARVAKILRQMSVYYQKSAVALLCVRLAQGIVHLGKGLLSLSPIAYRGDIIKRTSLSHLMVVIICCLNIQKHLLENHTHLILFHLISAASPKMLMIVDHETLLPEPVSMRVGQAVNTVGVPGNPRSVTSFQTHSSPIVIGLGDQAELDISAEGTLHDAVKKDHPETEEIRVELYSSMLEGVVLVQKTKTAIPA